MITLLHTNNPLYFTSIHLNPTTYHIWPSILLCMSFLLQFQPQNTSLKLLLMKYIRLQTTNAL